jgi:hypothetical protein
MALDPPDKWVKRLLEMKQSSSSATGAKELGDFYSEMADKVQGVGGRPGIFKFNKAVFAAQLSSGFGPEASAPKWANSVATAWLAAVNASTITPATVPNSAWTASSVDVQTAPTAAATIITANAAKAQLQAGLIASSNAFKSGSDEGMEQFAKAFHDATKSFVFLTVGLVATPASPVPLPIPTSAE